YAGRRVLLELADAAARRTPGKELVGRLRNARQHFGAAAELRAIGMFLRAGAVLETPKKKKNGVRLPEFVARLPSGSGAVVEVKALRQSDEMREMDRVV